VLTALGTVAFVTYKQRERQRLYTLAKEANGFSGNPTALEELAGETNPIVNDLLLDIAEDIETNPSIRIAAVKQLSRRHANVGTRIAELLRPQESLELREAIAEGLGHMECLEDCVRPILHYKERLFNKEPTAEQMLASSVPPGVRDAVEEDARRLDEKLTERLRTSSSSTTHVLSVVYGLGGPQPAKFSVASSQSLPSADVCPLLLQSAQQRREFPVSDEDPLLTFIEEVVNRHCTGNRRG